MKIEIKNRFNYAVIFSTDVSDDDPNPLRTAVKRAVQNRANLDGASLDGASLDGASLVGASLDGASLVRASLVGASLVRANLVRANLDGASLDGIRADVRAILDAAPNEVSGLLTKLRAGQIDGSCYDGACCCLVGTIAKVRGCSYEGLGFAPDASRPAERWFLAIRPGHAPEHHPVARITERWIVEWMAEHGQVVPPRPRHLELAELAELASALGPQMGDRARELLSALGWQGA